ncbi:MAG: type II toxin-antitoxin system HicA family toxin [Porticoccaceae bacterium]
MSKHQKALERLCSSPPAASIKWQELKGVLEHLGYKMLKGSGSRRKFFHPEKNDLIICHQPHPSPNVDKARVTDVIEHLKANGFI